MTRDELITASTQELGKLPADELEIITRHFDTEDRAVLAQRLAKNIDEFLGGDHPSTIPQAEWPGAHLQLLLTMHRVFSRQP